MSFESRTGPWYTYSFAEMRDFITESYEDENSLCRDLVAMLMCALDHRRYEDFPDLGILDVYQCHADSYPGNRDMVDFCTALLRTLLLRMSLDRKYASSQQIESDNAKINAALNSQTTIAIHSYTYI